jgi:hypothetical protein
MGREKEQYCDNQYETNTTATKRSISSNYGQSLTTTTCHRGIDDEEEGPRESTHTPPPFLYFFSEITLCKSKKVGATLELRPKTSLGHELLDLVQRKKLGDFNCGSLTSGFQRTNVKA